MNENYYAWLMLMGLFETSILYDQIGYSILNPNSTYWEIETNAEYLEEIRCEIYLNTEWT